MSLQKRSRIRKQRIIAHQAKTHDDAELWDLLFWQTQTPEDRLSALVYIHRDVQKIMEAEPLLFSTIWESGIEGKYDQSPVERRKQTSSNDGINS